MSAWLTWVRHDLGRQRGRIVALAVFVAVGAGTVMSAIDGARRSGSVVDRVEEIVRPATALVLPNEPGFDWGPVAALPEVEDLVEFPVLYFEVEGFEGEFGGFPPATPGAAERWERPVVVAGRAANQDRADEVTIDPATRERGIDVGDRITINLISMTDALAGNIDGAERRLVDVTVVGVAKHSFFAWEVQPTYAFFEAHEDLIVGTGGYVNALVRLERGDSDLAAFERRLIEATGRPIEVMDNRENIRQQRRAVELETAALGILGLAMFAAVAVLVGQAASRMVSAKSSDVTLLHQLGLGRRATAAAIASTPAFAVAAGILVSPVVSFALSEWYPIGVARDLEPAPGRQLDWVAAGLGIVAVGGVLFGVTALVAARAVRPTDRRVDVERESALTTVTRRVPAGIPAVLGARLALGHRPREGSARAVTWVAASGVAGVIAALTFAAGLHDAIDDPVLFGQWFEAGVTTDGEAVDVAPFAPLELDGIAHLRNVVATIEGQPVSTVSVERLAGEVGVTVRRGRAPARVDEIALAPEAMGNLDVDVGDTVDYEGESLVVVGEAFTPELGHTAYTAGAVVHPELSVRMVANGLPVKFALIGLDFPEGADIDAAIAALDEPLRSQILQWPPNGRQQALGTTATLPSTFMLFTVVMAFGAAAHGLATTVRRRRHEVAVLQVLGLTRSQARWTVVWHAVVAALVGVVIGAIVGHALGRTIWEAVAGQLPVLHRAPAAWVPIALVAPAAVLGAMALAVWPARRTARSEPALVLRTE